MPDYDFLTNVESTLLTTLTANALLNEYNWQRWDSDEQVQLPRGVLGLRARRDPEESPYHRIDVIIKFEGRPKKQKLSTVMNELLSVLKNTSPNDLTLNSNNTVTFIGKAINIAEDRPIVTGLRTWTLGFVIYALPMN
jgi:hypothetical protein